MTKASQAFHAAVRELGCIVCRLFLHTFSPCDVHHLLSGGRRIGEMHVIGLCEKHHRSGENNAGWISRHPWRAAFVKRYGTEESLLAATIDLVQRREAGASRSAIGAQA